MSQVRIDKDGTVLEPSGKIRSPVDGLQGCLEDGLCRNHLPPATVAEGSIMPCEYAPYARTAGSALCRDVAAQRCYEETILRLFAERR